MGSDVAKKTKTKKQPKNARQCCLIVLVTLLIITAVTDPAAKVNMLSRKLCSKEGKNKVETCFLYTYLGKNSLEP